MNANLHTSSAIPRSALSWTFDLLQDGEPQVEVVVNSFREKGFVRIRSKEYRVHREGLLTGPFVLVDGLRTVATADKPSAFKRRLDIDFERRRFVFKADSAFYRAMTLYENDAPIGSIEPQSAFSRKADLHLPDDLPQALQGFLLWLTLVLWRRQQESSS